MTDPNLSLQNVKRINVDEKQQLSEPLISHPDADDINDPLAPKKKNYKCRICIFFTIGFILMIFSIQLIFIPHFINHTIHQTIIDAFVFTHPEPDNSHYQSWQTNSASGSVPIYFAIQFFNVTNPDGVLKRGEFPKLNLTQPIVYNQYFYRKNVNFSDDGEYVKHIFWTEYLYNPELSKIDPSARYTVMSPILGTLYYQYAQAGTIEKEEMKIIIDELSKHPEMLFWSNQTATDLIWSVYSIDINHPISGRNIWNFSWGFMRNQSNQYYVLHTGHNDPSRMGEVQRWCRDPLTIDCLEDESSLYLDVWDPPMSIKPGHLFYVGVYTLQDIKNKNDVKPLWVDILFRNIYLTYNKTYNFKGITLDKYGIQFDPMLLNTTQYPPNQQFNQFGPSGILNSTAAYDGISIFLSMVLFYGAPDYLKNNTKIGLDQPGAYDYPYIDIEPKTGAVFYANASMQICTEMHSLPMFKKNQTRNGLFNLTDGMMIPIYLVTFSDELTDSIANNFKSNINLGDALHTTSIVVGWISVGLLIIWLLFAFFGLGVCYQDRPTKRDSVIQ